MGYHLKILKETVEQISTPLARVALQEGSVPLEWKEANIIPLFKKRSRSKSVNYGPVSLTSVICKLWKQLLGIKKRQMLFNFGKCKCLHTGPGNTGMH